MRYVPAIVIALLLGLTLVIGAVHVTAEPRTPTATMPATSGSSETVDAPAVPLALPAR